MWNYFFADPKTLILWVNSHKVVAWWGTDNREPSTCGFAAKATSLVLCRATESGGWEGAFVPVGCPRGSIQQEVGGPGFHGQD